MTNLRCVKEARVKEIMAGKLLVIYYLQCSCPVRRYSQAGFLPRLPRFEPLVPDNMRVVSCVNPAISPQTHQLDLVVSHSASSGTVLDRVYCNAKYQRGMGLACLLSWEHKLILIPVSSWMMLDASIVLSTSEISPLCRCPRCSIF